MSSVEAVMRKGQCKHCGSRSRTMKSGSIQAWKGAVQRNPGFAYGCIDVGHALSVKPMLLTLSSSPGDV